MKTLETGPWWTFQTITESVRRKSFWMEVLGALMILYGIIALGHVVSASVVSVFVIGGVLLAAGVTQIAATVGYWVQRRGVFALGMILGCLCAIAGILCFTNPARSMEVLTFILAIYFIASGIARLTITVSERFPGWGWGVVSAAAELILGVLILATWPAAGLVVLGTLLGIQLIVAGVSAIATGSAVRRIVAPRGEPHHGRPATRFQH